MKSVPGYLAAYCRKRNITMAASNEKVMQSGMPHLEHFFDFFSPRSNLILTIDKYILIYCPFWELKNLT